MQLHTARMAGALCLAVVLLPWRKDVAAQQAVTIGELKARAEADDVDALFALAVLHETGREVSLDPARAVALYRRAAGLGDAAAKAQLGLLYQTGTGVAKDEAQALQLFKEAAEAGDAEGMFRLGMIYAYGIGITRDAAVARRWFSRAANLGHQEAQLMTGLLVYHGLGGAQNDFAARRWLREATRGRDRDVAARAQNVFGELDERLSYAGLQSGEWKALFLAVSVGLLLLAGSADADISSQQRTQDPSNPYNYGALSTTRRKEHCTYVSNSFMTLHGSRAIMGGPGTIRQCVNY